MKWLDRDGAIWYTSKLINEGHSMDNACFAALKIEEYCVNGNLISKHQEKKFRSAVLVYIQTGKYPKEYTNI
jgi:hypothetical protein